MSLPFGLEEKGRALETTDNGRVFYEMSGRVTVESGMPSSLNYE